MAVMLDKMAIEWLLLRNTQAHSLGVAHSFHSSKKQGGVPFRHSGHSGIPNFQNSGITPEYSAIPPPQGGGGHSAIPAIPEFRISRIPESFRNIPPFLHPKGGGVIPPFRPFRNSAFPEFRNHSGIFRHSSTPLLQCLALTLNPSLLSNTAPPWRTLNLVLHPKHVRTPP
jgi:hypothetical protein